MSIQEIDEILKGRFSSEDDRKYWERKRAELETKEANGRENQRYFTANARYDR